MTSVHRPWTWLAALGLVSVLLGCKGNPTSSPAPPAGGQPGQGGEPAAEKTFDADSEPFATGKKALVAGGCFQCHTVNGARGAVTAKGGPPMAGGPPGPGGPRPGGGMGRKGPDLGQVGKDPAHTVDWVVKYIRDPKSVKPDSKMPPQPEGKVKDDDLRALAEYLVSLK